MISLAIAAAETAVATKVVGVSANGYITAIVGVIVSFMGAGGLYGIFKGLAFMAEQKNNRAKIDNDAATVVRREMLEISDRQQKRIDELEKSGREEAKRFYEEIAAMRAEHAKEMAAIRSAHADEMASLRERHEIQMRNLRDEITGTQRDLIQNQQSSGRAAILGTKSTTHPIQRADEAGIGDVLRNAFPVVEGDI